MEASSGRFSIREYAAKKRIVDLAKSWPFVGEKYKKSPLPPISIGRFRWWADEARSAAEAAETEVAEAQVDEPNEIIEHQLPKYPPAATMKKTTKDEELRSPKTKTKMPKKRSIVELFASAPLVESSQQFNGKDGYGEGEEEEVDEEEEEEEEEVMMRKRKGKRRKGAIKVDIRVLTKEKVSKPKIMSSGDSHLLQDPINMKALQKTAEGVVESKKRFAKVKTLQRKHKILQTPNQMVVKKKLPVRSILKNKNKITLVRKTRKISKTKTVNFIKRCCKTTRHVTFSEKDDIFGHGKKRSSIDIPQMKSFCKIFSDALTKSSVMSNSSKVHELQAANDGPQMVNAGEEDDNTAVADRKDESSSEKNQSSDSLGDVNHGELVNSSNSSYSSTEKASMAVMIDLNHAIESCDDLNCFNHSTEDLSPSCTNSSDLDFKFTTHKKGSLTSITPTERNFVSTSNATDLLYTMKNLSPHSSTSCLIAGNDKNEKHCGEYFHCSPKDLLSNNICYSMESNKCRGSVWLAGSVSTSQNKISLPLNKQELIQMHPGTKFVEPYKKQNYADKQVDHDINMNHLMNEKVIDAASYQNDHLNWCQNQYYPSTERRFIEFIGPERFSNQNSEPVKARYEFLHSHANRTMPSFHDGKIGDGTIDFFKRVDLQGKCNLGCHLDPAVQPTIRLMGQNVVVGGSDRDCHSSIMPETYLSTCGSSTSSHALYHKAFLNKFRGNSFAGEESKRNQYYPTIASYQQNIDQNVILSSTNGNHSHGVSFGTFGTPQSQVRYSVRENPFQSVQIQPPDKLPQLILQAKHQKWNQLSSSLYSDPTDLMSQPCRFSETNPTSHLSPYGMPMVHFSVDNISPAKTSTFASNSSQSSFISVVTATNSISEVTKSNALKNKEKEGSYSSFTGFRSPVDAQRFQKRPPGRDDAFMNSAKRPYFEPQEINMMRDHPFFRYATALNVQKAVNEVDELSNAESSSFSRVDKESAVGGAKHVLKSNQKIELFHH